MTHVLSVGDVSHSFGTLRVLENVSFDLGQAEVVALIGPNGSGKSTLFNLIGGLLYCDSGRILLNGTSIVGLKPHVIARAGIARTFQTPKPLSGMTVLENVMAASLHAYGGSGPVKDLQKDAVDILEQCGLSRYAHLDACYLSFDKLRLLELARSIGMKPRLLLVDEIFSGLGQSDIDLVSKLIVKMKDDFETATLASGHSIGHLAKIAQRFLVLSRGKIIARGSFEEISSDAEVLTTYLGGRIAQN